MRSGSLLRLLRFGWITLFSLCGLGLVRSAYAQSENNSTNGQSSTQLAEPSEQPNKPLGTGASLGTGSAPKVEAESASGGGAARLSNIPSTVAEMTARIDHLIGERLSEVGWQPAGPCEDAAFIRRAQLDLTGTPPKAAEVADFLEDQESNKRSLLINRLLRSPGHSEHLASIWASWLVQEEANNPLLNQQSGLRNWLRDRFRENLRYDRLLADLLVSTGSPQTGPAAFFVSLEGKPEKVAAQTARVFMGLQLDCAECHDHPFDRWKQEDFWGLAAYFAQVSPVGEQFMNRTEVYDTGSGEVTMPGTDQVVPPKPLIQPSQTAATSGTRRQQLTLWLTTPENPFLAKAAVNRVWALLMGRGFIEPVDDMRETQIPTHPELLNELSVYFAATGYDLRQLIEAICGSKAYWRATKHPSGQPPEGLMAVMELKPLTERQLANSVIEVARQLGPNGRQTIDQLVGQLGNLRGEASQSKVGIVNALVTLHGDLLDQATGEQSSRLLKALQAPYLDQREQVRWLFLSTLNRYPSIEEEQALSELASEAAQKEPPNWQSDLLWALLNSTEFAMTP